MSTRAQVIIQDQSDQLWFYRHCDGYPDGVRETLWKFLDLIADGTIRDNASQSAGWLVIIGHEEYNKIMYPPDWQVGAYEPCSPALYENVEYLYRVDVVKQTITCRDIFENEEYTLIREEDE